MSIHTLPTGIAYRCAPHTHINASHGSFGLVLLVYLQQRAKQQKRPQCIWDSTSQGLSEL